MRKVLFILSELLDDDVEWLANAGDRLRYPVGAELIPYGGQPDSVYFVLDGTFSVLAGNGELVAELSSGEVIGEMSLVDPARTTASVRANEGASALRVSHVRLREKLDTDAAFAARFYRALSVFMSARMRQTTRRYGYGGLSHPGDAQVDEISEALLEKAHLASMRFERLLKRMAS
ncbi:Cyclic nucleotide-binding domain-containing protein [Duganella sacchari]|uniref:Cyclic nucleotide-binding domain-containing protein n=1 Tax=Duganella sacchari TaxID=551987 RepID=A0A1M7QMY0_9BURK|nr:cyclic nucleotide-binding domain-containing protein [Duganella sacchari]SHN32666.1 Cyclic nucleotide-binding domain-containing protein [Duganella sacchari]